MSVFRSDLFRQKVCLVTGGGSGIGRAISLELMQLGATVVIASRKKERLEAAVAQLNSCGTAGTASWVEVNIRDESSVEAAVRAVVSKYGRIDSLVNNGGGQFASEAAAIKPKGWRAVIETNLNGTWFMTQAVYMAVPPPRKGLAVVNITADFHNGFPGMAHTGAARAGVDNLTKTLAREWAAEGIRVNSVAPGIICSTGLENYPAALRPQFIESGKSVPLGRCGTESEVAAATVFLLSPAASYISGATLRVDGGGSLSKQDFITPPKDLQEPLAPFHLSEQLKQEYDARVAPTGNSKL